MKPKKSNDDSLDEGDEVLFVKYVNMLTTFICSNRFPQDASDPNMLAQALLATAANLALTTTDVTEDLFVENARLRFQEADDIRRVLTKKRSC